MKVYCLITDWTCDGECGSYVEIFETREKAHKAFITDVEKERKESPIYYYEENVVEKFSEEEETFCVYEKGHFLEYNIQIHVVECEIK